MAIMRTLLMLALGAALAGATPRAASAQTNAPAATLRLAIIPVANYAPLVVARDKGFFTDENLNVTWTNVNQGAIAVEAVFGGSVEIGGSSIFEPIVARGNGLDLVFIAASAQRFVNLLAFGIVGREIPKQDKRGIDFLTRELECFHHPQRIFPWIESGDLHN